MKLIIGVVIVVWLVIGAAAAGQRGYFGDDREPSTARPEPTPG